MLRQRLKLIIISLDYMSMLGLGYPVVRWVFPEEGWEKTKQVSSVQQLKQITDSMVWRFENKIIPFIKEGDKYYHISRSEHRIKSLFDSLQQRWPCEKQAHKSTAKPISKVSDLLIQFKYKPEHEIQQKFAKLQQIIQTTSKELSLKIEKTELQSYYNNIRIEKKKSYLKSDTNMKKVKIWFLISEPLVKRCQPEGEGQGQIKILESLKEELKIHEHKQLIKEVHDSQNWSISLSMQRLYMSWQKICSFVRNMKLKHNQSEINKSQQAKEELNVLHIYTEIQLKGAQFYVSLQADQDIGGECRNVTLGKFIEKLNQIPNLYTIILIGPGMRILKPMESQKMKKKKKNQQEQAETGLDLKQLGLRKMGSNIFRSNLKGEIKQWHKMANVPIVTIGVYDAQKDLMRKYFMKYFYSNLFRRKSILECFENAKLKIKQYSHTSHQNITNCCCMHPTENQPMWSKLVDAIGNSTIHKIFKHGDTTSLKGNLENPEMFKELISFILGLSEEERSRKNLFRCLDVKHNAYRQKQGDILLFNNKFDSGYLPIPAEKEHWEAGELIYDGIKPVKNNRYRPLVIYQILQQITSCSQFGVLAITGSSKSGKSLFIQLVESYLTQRANNYICQPFRTGEDKEIIIKFLRQAQRKQKETDEDDLPGKQPKLILILGKINYEIKEEFEKFVKSASEVPRIRQVSLLILAALSQTSEIRNKQIKVYKIPPITDIETKYFILRDKSIQLNFQNHVIILKEIVEAFQRNEEGNIKNEVQFSNFCKELNRMISSIYSLRKKPDERIKIINYEIQKYITKTNTVLDCMRVERNQCWEDTGFLCSFKESFYICDFNEKIALTTKGFIQEMGQSESHKGQFFRLFEQRKFSNKQQKSILIQAEMKCYQYFLNFTTHFFEKKINYFFNFYYLVYSLIKNNPKDKFAEHYGRIFEKLGIFMYEYEPKLQQLTSEEERRQRLMLAGASQTQKQREYIYKFVLEKHVYTYIEFLKQMKTSWSGCVEGEREKIKLLFLIVYSMLLASICHKYLDSILGQKKAELNNQMKKFINSNKITHPEIGILLFQIGSLIGAQNGEESSKQDHGSQGKILRTLRQYQQVKHEYEQEMEKLSRLEVWSESVQESAVGTLSKISNTICELKINIKSGELNGIKLDKHYECILDLILAKIMIRYHHFNHENADSIDEINFDHLKSQLDQIELRIPRVQCREEFKYVYSHSVIQLCSLYLKAKINIHLCKDSDLRSVASDLPPLYQPMHSYLKQKLNPKTLFKCGNIALFMKAGCLKVNELSYNFVRMSNIISPFLTRKLSSRNINLLFLNLSVKNFEMLSEEAPPIHYFILSIDSLVNKKNSLQLIFEDHQTISAKLIDIKTFASWLRKIKAKFLILVGSKSEELCKQISESLNKENICVISLTLNRPCLDLSTYPEVSGEPPFQIKPVEIVNSFIKIENSRRMVEMTICCLITLLAQEKNIYVNQENVKRIITQSIKISKKVIESWYQNKPTNPNLLYQILYYVHVQDHQTEFPQIPLGEVKNLTSQLTATPYNFKDDAYYENVGRANHLSEIMKRLSGGKANIIEIVGGRRSGKTELLKQVGWFCQTRSLFQLGVYMYDIKQLLQKRNLHQILNHLDQQSLNKQYLLILLDNLQPAYISNNVTIFSNFFLALETKAVSLIYTIQHESNQDKTTPTQYQLVNDLLETYLRESTKKYQLYSLDINILDEVQKICIALINFRNRSTHQYNEIFETYFPDLWSLKIRPKSKDLLKSKDSNEYKLKRKIRKKKSSNKLKRIKTEQSYLQLECKSLSQKLIKNKSVQAPYQPGQREASFESEGNSDDFSEQNSRDFAEIEEQNISDQQGGSIQGGNMSPICASGRKCKSGSSDLNVVLELCERYKRRMKEEKAEMREEEIYEREYTLYDIEQLMQELQYLSGVEIQVQNPMYFSKSDDGQ